MRLVGAGGAAAVLLLVIASAAVLSSDAVTERGVTDLAAAERFLDEEAARFAVSDPAASGELEYLLVPRDAVRSFLNEQGVYDAVWEASSTHDVTAIFWTSPAVSYEVPRPRPGHEVTLTGTLVVLIAPEEGTKSVLIIQSDQLGTLRDAASDRQTERYTLEASY